MTRPMKVCFWTTTFQADVLALARWMCADDRFEPIVALESPTAFEKEPIQQLLPVSCPLLDRDAGDVLDRIRDFAPDVTVVDNHFPPKRLSEHLFVLWHGFGWKGPNDVKEFGAIHKAIRRLTGASSMKPNPRFLWQCFGDTDLEHRNGVSGFARENLASLGSAFTDELVAPRIDRADAKAHYPDLPEGRKVILVALTWHYGRAFAHWGDDIELFSRVLDHLRERGCCAIIRMHDRKRFEPEYLAALEDLVSGRDDAILKFKDRDRDSLLDMIVSDAMISNFSSILNYFYATGKPSIHVYPVAAGSEAFLWRTWKRGKVRTKKVPSADYVWKLPPEENGGLVARTFEDLLSAIDRAVDDPRCCEDTSRDFIDRHMAPVDGGTRERIGQAILDLARGQTA